MLDRAWCYALKMTDISQVLTPDGADRYRISHYIVQWFEYFENMYNVIVCADSSGGRMELYLFTISSLMAYATLWSLAISS